MEKANGSAGMLVPGDGTGDAFERLFECVTGAYFLHDLAGRLVGVSPAAERLTGYPRTMLIGRTLAELDLLAPEQVSGFSRALAKCALGEPAGSTGLTIHQRDGSQTSVELRYVPLRLVKQVLVLVIASGLAGDDPAAAASRTAPRTVLVVDDESGVRNSLKRILVREGYTALCAGDGNEAIRLSTERRGMIDLVICDLVLPGMSSRELIARIAATQPQAFVLFMSGYAAEDVRSRGLVDAGEDLIEKPFSVDAIARKLRTMLAQA